MRKILIMAMAATAVALAQAPAADATTGTAVISGKVTAPSGEPVARATVVATVLPSGTGAIVGTALRTVAATTNAEGSFTLEHLDAGNYILAAEKAGFLRTQYSSNQRLPGAGALLSLKAGQQISGVNVVMMAQSVISGRVLDEDGDPAARVQVSALRRYFLLGRVSYGMQARATTDENGEYKLTGLGAGKYLVSAAPLLNVRQVQDMRRPAADLGKPEEAPVLTFYPGVRNLSDAAAVTVTAGQNVPGTNIRIVKAAVFHIRGHVSGAIPPGAGAADVSLFPVDGAPFASQKSIRPEKDGSFEISGVSAGAYAVMLIRRGGPPLAFASVRVQVDKADVDNVSLQAVPPSDIAGIVRMEGTANTSGQVPQSTPSPEGLAQQTPSYRINLMPADSAMYTFVQPPTVGPDGTFVLQNVTAGRYQITVLNPMGGYVKSIRLGGREMVDTGLIVPPGATGPLEIILSPDAGRITGTVTARDGQPLSRSTIILIPDAPNAGMDRYKLGAAGANGQFQMVNVPPGKYRIYAAADIEQGSQFDPDFTQAHQGESQTVTVEEGRTVQVNLTQ